VWCGVCGTAATLSSTLSSTSLEARSPRLAKPPRRTCFPRPRLSPHAPRGSPPHAVATAYQLRLPLCSRPVAARHRTVAAPTPFPLRPHAVATRHCTLIDPASPPLSPHAVATPSQLRLPLRSSTSRPPAVHGPGTLASPPLQSFARTSLWYC
jgi:hypothetical protein